MLTQLTGEEAIVREFPTDNEDWRVGRVIRRQLNDSKPMLVSSRPREYPQEELPHNLDPCHVYEVVGLDKGRIQLRNPWNRNHPDFMQAEEFQRNMRPWYVTLR